MSGLEVKESARYVIVAKSARGIPKKDVRGHADPFVLPVLEKLPATAFADGKVSSPSERERQRARGGESRGKQGVVEKRKDEENDE